MELKQKLTEYKELEIKRETHKSLLDSLKQKFEDENRDLINELNEINQKQEEIKQFAREKALEEYSKTGNKKLQYGLGIRVLTKLEYDEERALKWAFAHNLCLTLDTKAFERIAKTQQIEFVKSVETPTATFPSKLEI